MPDDRGLLQDLVSLMLQTRTPIGPMRDRKDYPAELQRAIDFLHGRGMPSAELGTTPECQQTINHMSRQAELLDEEGNDVSAGVMRDAMKVLVAEHQRANLLEKERDQQTRFKYLANERADKAEAVLRSPSATASITDNYRRWRFLEHGCQWVSFTPIGGETKSFDPRHVTGYDGDLPHMRAYADEQSAKQVAQLRAEAEEFGRRLKK